MHESALIVALIIGILIGYVLAIPPGPIGLAAIRTGMREGWRSSVKLAIGAGAFDVLYCAGAMVATGAIVGMLDAVDASLPWITIALQFVIVFGMILFGVVQMRERPPVSDSDSEPQGKPNSVLDWMKGHGPFFVGVGFAIANLANPTFVPALAAMATFVQQLHLFEHGFHNNMVFALGFGIGNMLWLFTLVRLVIANKHKLTPTLMLRVQQVTGVTLIGFGVFYAVRVIVLTDWSYVLLLTK